MRRPYGRLGRTCQGLIAYVCNYFVRGVWHSKQPKPSWVAES